MKYRKFTFLKFIVSTTIFIAFHLLGSSINAEEVSLTTAEEKWLEEHPVIKVGHGVGWPPFSMTENGVPTFACHL